MGGTAPLIVEEFSADDLSEKKLENLRPVDRIRRNDFLFQI